MCHCRSLKILHDEEFARYFAVDCTWNLIPGRIVLLKEEKALLRLCEVPDVENCKSVEKVSEFRAQMRILIGRMQWTERRVSVLPLVCQIDGTRIHNQV